MKTRTIVALLSTCLTLLAPPRAWAQVQVGDFSINNPLGFEPLVLHGGQGHFIALGALGLSLLLSDAGDPSNTENGMIRTGSWFLVNHGAYYRGYDDDPTAIFTGRIGFGYMLRDWLAIGLEFHATKFKDDRLDGGGTEALGGGWFVRWHPVRKSTWTVYFEYGASLIFSDDAFPPGGTEINGSPIYGVGAAFRVSQKFYLNVGARHLHISNGGFAGEDRHRGFDSHGVYVGYQYHF